MTNLRRVLLASAAVAAAVPALPATASADPIFTCSPTFLIGPLRCQLAETESQVREDPPVIRCSPAFLVGPTQCKVEGAIRSAPDPT